MSHSYAYNDPRHVDPRSRGAYPDSYRYNNYYASTSVYPWSGSGHPRGRGRGRGGHDRGRGRGGGRRGKPQADRATLRNESFSRLSTTKNVFAAGDSEAPAPAASKPRPATSRAADNLASQTPSLVSHKDSQPQSPPPSSPPMLDALDSLDKLIRFSASVGVGDPASEGIFEPSKLASIAESFLNRQNSGLASNNPREVLVSSLALRLGPESGETMPSPCPSTPSFSPRTRAAELKELLKKRKAGAPKTPVMPIPAALPNGPKVVIPPATSPQKRRREPVEDLPPPKQVAVVRRRSSSPCQVQDGSVKITTPSPPRKEALSNMKDRHSSATNSEPERYRGRSSEPPTERSLAYTHRSSRSPMRYESYGGSRYEHFSRYGPSSDMDARPVRSEGRQSDVTMVGVRGSTASLLSRLTLGSQDTLRLPSPGPAAPPRDGPRLPPAVADRVDPGVWRGEYRKDNFPTEPLSRPPAPPELSPLNVDTQNLAAPTSTLSPAVAQDVLETLAALKAQIAKLEAQLPLTLITAQVAQAPAAAIPQPPQLSVLVEEPRRETVQPRHVPPAATRTAAHRAGPRRSLSPIRAQIRSSYREPEEHPGGPSSRYDDRRPPRRGSFSPPYSPPSPAYSGSYERQRVDRGPQVYPDDPCYPPPPLSPRMRSPPSRSPEWRGYVTRGGPEYNLHRMTPPWEERERVDRFDGRYTVARGRGRGRGRGGARGRGRGV